MGTKMKYTRSAWLLTVLVTSICGVQPALADSSTIPLIVLTDKASSSAGVSEAFAARTKEKRSELLEQIAKNRADMAKNGFVVVSDQQAALSDLLFGEIIAYQASHKEGYSLIASRLGYSAIDPNDASFDAGTLIAMMPVESDDKSIHQMFYAFAFDDIGQLVIEELSFATVPDVKITVAAPAGNVSINGNPGTYIVSVNESRSRAVSSLDFLTKDKMFVLTTSSRLEVGSDGYLALLSVAESLY
jgi:hypothetical protein